MKFANLFSALLGCSLVAAIPSAHPRSSCGANKPKVKVKKISNFCETKPGVKSYSGHVTIPPSAEFPFEQNIFFWFFESRHKPKTDPLTVWINGGPGSPSTDQALGHNGPCKVNSDSKTTVNNPWSWNNRANLLYIDSPVQTGFSYDSLVSGQISLETGQISNANTGPPPADTVLENGVFSSQDPSRTVNTSQNVARVLWTFMQAWLREGDFKHCSRAKIHLWSQSYGGHWVPAIAKHFETQSTALATSPPPLSANILCRPRPIRIASVGIIAAYVDLLAQGPASFDYSHTNTYGIEIYTPAQASSLETQFNQPGGCADQISACRAAIDQFDPEGFGNQPAVAAACGLAAYICVPIEAPFFETSLDVFDITKDDMAHFPPPYAYGFLNRPNVQDRLGTKVNYTAFSTLFNIGNQFVFSGDLLRSFSPEVTFLLDASIPVHLIYGDRDFRSNWFGGEALALSLGGTAFASAGYAPLTVAGSPAGHTRQAGRFSFTKLDGAGHEAPHYKPQESYAIYQRALDGKDIATGSVSVGAGYATTGQSDVRGIPAPPIGPPPPTFCYTRRTPLKPGQCTEAQLAALRDGTAVVQDFVVVGPAWSAP